MNYDTITLELNGDISLAEATYVFAYGSVKGIVETITTRKERTFTLYDSLFDRAVMCYFEQDLDEQVRIIWGKKVLVSGYIGRDQETGQPAIIQNICNIELVPEIATDRYRDARGVLPWNTGDENAEDAIRRLRDAS